MFGDVDFQRRESIDREKEAAIIAKRKREARNAAKDKVITPLGAIRAVVGPPRPVNSPPVNSKDMWQCRMCHKLNEKHRAVCPDCNSNKTVVVQSKKKPAKIFHFF